MDAQDYVHWSAAGAVGLFFIGSGAAELSKWRSSVPSFVSMGYPGYWPIVTYALKILFGAMVFAPRLQLAGLAGAAAVVVVGVASLMRVRDPDAPKAAVPGAVILAVIALAVWTGQLRENWPFSGA